MLPLKRFLSAPAAHVLQIFTILHLGVKHEGDAQPPTLCCVAAQRTPPPPPTHHSASHPLVSCSHRRLLHPVGFLRHLSLKAAAAAAASLCVCVCAAAAFRDSPRTSSTAPTVSSLLFNIPTSQTRCSFFHFGSPSSLSALPAFAFYSLAVRLM